jgi:putative oxidoreductase
MILFSGLDLPEVAISMSRISMGVFFTISGYHKLFNKERHATITQTMVADGVPLVRFNSWFVPSVEFAGGMGLLVGLLAPLAALGLFAVCVVATLVDGLKRITVWQPVDKADYVDDVLYLPEVLYAIILLTIILHGGGPFSVDAYIARLL